MLAARKPQNFIEKIQATRPSNIFLVRGRDSMGKQAWYYVSVSPEKRHTFKQKEGSASLKLSEYGTILFSGFGLNPPSSIKKIMEKDYGFKD